MKCSFCNNKHLNKIINGRYSLLPYVIDKETKKNLHPKYKEIINLEYYICQECGLISSDLDKKYIKLLNIIYTKYYKHYSRYGIIDFEIDSFLEFIDKYLKYSKSLLEIGCFDGYVLFRIKKKYENLNSLGIDPLEEAIKRAKKHGISCICDFFPTPKLVSKFDLIFSRHVIEHTEDPYKFLKTQKDSLNKNGIIVFETPNFEWSIMNNEALIFHPQHLKILSKKYVQNLLKRLDFRYFDVKEITHRILFAASNFKYSGMKSVNEMETNESIIGDNFTLFQDVSIKKQEDLAKLFEKIDSIAIWGAGSFTGDNLALLDKELTKKIEFIADSDLTKLNHVFISLDKVISSPVILKEKEIKNLIIMSQYVDEILESIKELDLNYSFNIYSLVQGIHKYYYDSTNNSIQKTINT
jgi:2-polyprenyl-3-methyl-5-hydroxy-6-metoxy-1,4-benzoquinol methylase